MTYNCTAGTNRRSRPNENEPRDKISSIADAGNTTQGGFRASSGAMTYDANGNMISNAAKGITSISYNHLNLPNNITITGGKTIDFTYDAIGIKLRKVVKTGATINLVQEYVNGIEYRGSAIPATTIEGIFHAEGRLYNNAGWKREYTIKDHLGNTRVAYCDLNSDGVVATPSEILQENSYDPFGFGLDGVYMNSTNPDNLYQYNGKEWNNDHGIGLYDYGARWYDAGVGRWTTVDPMAEKMPSWSTFNYGFNNPIKFTDPTGMAPDNEYQMVHNANGITTTTQISTKGGDQQDIIHHSNGVPIPQNGASGYTEVVDNTTGGQRLAPGVFADRPASGQLTPIDDPLSAVEKGGATLAMGILTAVVKHESKEVAGKFTVRRFMSKSELKQLKKEGIDYNPELGNGIPSTTRNFTPKNQASALRRTGANNAEYQVDLDVSGLPRGPTTSTRGGLPEYPIQGNITPDRIIPNTIKRVPKS